MKVKIEQTDYILDINAAKRAGVLKVMPEYPLRGGDVYTHPTGRINSFLLVQVTWEDFYKKDAKFQLLGLGATPNSSAFFESVHTREEIAEYLAEDGMVFSHNISNAISNLVNKC